MCVESGGGAESLSLSNLKFGTNVKQFVALISVQTVVVAVVATMMTTMTRADHQNGQTTGKERPPRII